MLHIGNQTAWTARPTDPFEYALERQFDAFEWFPDKKPGAGWDDGDLDARVRKSIRETAAGRGMRLSVHARWQANPLAPEGDALLRKDLELARDLGAVLLNIHLFHEQGVAAFLQAIRPLIQLTAELELQLSIENTPHHSPEDFNEFFQQLRNLSDAGVGHVGMCLDVGHANLCAATLNNYLGFLDRLAPQVPIIHLHLHENWGDADSHLPLFTGPAGRDDSGIRGLVERLQRRQFSGAAILEQWPAPPALLDQARDRLLKLWPQNGGRRSPEPRPSPAVPSVESQAEPPRALADDGCIRELVAGDRQARSWREKLEFARGLVARDNPPITTDNLVTLAVYLRFLGTGEIACAEDGRHFRPAHHARIAEQMRARLAALASEENAFVLRKIYPWLPSSAADFRRAEPLTRIRDIAHRNDIDPDLKREIKTTLQNKLHRCAGPEDLQTSSALLARITAPGTNYSPAFVEQFRIFHEELKEFFNAQSLEKRLKALKGDIGAKQAELIPLFLQQKSGTGLTERRATFRTLTALREALANRAGPKSSGDNPDSLLADIALEDFAFALLSELINQCETADVNQADEARLEALTLALRNLELSAIAPAESQALRNELQTWGKLSASAQREEILRLKSCLLRCRGLAENFGARIITMFLPKAQQLGPALGVAPAAVRVFGEADLRGHLVFQLSKLVSALLRHVRERLHAPAWDVLVIGRAEGKLQLLESLGDFAGDSRDPAVLFLNGAAGDEEIPGNVTGIVLGHELPHLSHLSVRARQAGVVFVSCEDTSESAQLRELKGKQIALTATGDGVSWEIVTTSEPSPDATRPKVKASVMVPRAQLSPETPWIPLEQATLETSGGKAQGARRLAEVSAKDASVFRTPQSLVIPFGVMEAALAAAPELQAEYGQLLRKVEKSPKEIGALAHQLRDIVRHIAVPGSILSEVTRRFGPEAALVVRSSSNCEDLEQLAGAGLYESVINVPPKKLGEAVQRVWSSLWTERAALSRHQAGIPHEQAHMAVLIQQLLDPDLSFVLHTVNPINHNDQEVYAEVVVGLGETLVSAASRGTPYRLTCDKHSSAVTTLAFANFSHAARPNREGGVKQETLDYANVELSRDAGARQKLGQRLAKTGLLVEQALGRPQDIEGGVVKDQIYLVQSRPQQGLTSPKAKEN